MLKQKTRLILCAIGILSFGAGMYIQSEVNKGREQIESAQESKDRAGSLLPENPLSDELGSAFQGKIDEGSEKANRYAHIARILKIGGVIVILIGAGSYFLCRKKK